jgi:hypothetical protein
MGGYYTIHDRDRLALKMFKFNEYVRKNHPESCVRFRIVKEPKEDPVYALNINGTEYYCYDYGKFSYDNIYKIEYMTDSWIYKLITESPLPEW